MGDGTCTRHHILVVDDEPAVAQILARHLERAGYRVTVCTGSAGALQCFGADPGAFDLLLTDFHMPGGDGLALARALCQLRPDLPILVCTGNSRELPPAKAWPANLRGVVEKPVSGRAIAAAVQQALGPRSSPSAPTT